MLAGDFNSHPSSAVYELLTQGSVAKSHPDCAIKPLPNKSSVHSSVRIPHERLTHSLDLSSAYATVCGEEPECTNVKDEFSGYTQVYIMYNGLYPQFVLEVVTCLLCLGLVC